MALDNPAQTNVAIQGVAAGKSPNSDPVELMESNKARLEQDLRDATAMREQLESILRQRDEEFRAQTSRVIDLQRQRDEAIAQLRHQETKYATAEAKLNDAAKSRDSEDRRAEALLGDIEGLRAELELVRSTAESKRQGLEAELAKLKTTLIAVQNEYARLRDDVAPSMAKAARHNHLMQVLPPWLENLLVRFGGGKTG
jgi:chromosome segregation ATPase